MWLRLPAGVLLSLTLLCTEVLVVTPVDPFEVPMAALVDAGLVDRPTNGRSGVPAPPVVPAADVTASADVDGAKARARGVASGGKQVELPANLPSAPHWPGSGGPEDEYVPDEEFDASDLMNVNREINRARARLFRVSASMRGAQRKCAEADLLYRRQLRRALVQVSGGSAEIRKAVAELQCEPHENALIVAVQVADEYKKRAMDVRDDLKALENLSHNVRAQMNAFERQIPTPTR